MQPGATHSYAPHHDTHLILVRTQSRHMRSSCRAEKEQLGKRQDEKQDDSEDSHITNHIDLVCLAEKYYFNTIR